ncbi:MAG: cyclic nucleotide-binding domain-containing protein [Chloroflexota bacterium]
MLSTVERVLFLRSADIFSAVASEDLVGVSLAAEETTVQAGEVLIRQGDPGDCLYVLVSGEVRVVVRGQGQVAVLGPNSVVGELGLLSGRPRTADCMATVETLALRLARDEFWALMEDRPAVALGVIRVLTRRIEDTTARLAQLQATSPSTVEYRSPAVQDGAEHRP